MPDQGRTRHRDQKSEIYGRVLVVIAAEQHASRLVVPSSQQHPSMRWTSHKDHARKALAKLAGPHLRATLKQVEKAVAKAHSEHEAATSRATDRTASGESEPVSAEPIDSDELDEHDVDEIQDEDLDEDEGADGSQVEEVGGGVPRTGP